MSRVTSLIALAAVAAAPSPPTPLQRDLAGYATASCFAALPQPLLRKQGERWAGAVIQRGHGAIEAWASLARAVTKELKRTGLDQGLGDGPDSAPTPLPVMTCGEITARPAVRAAMAQAAKALAKDYVATTR